MSDICGVDHIAELYQRIEKLTLAYNAMLTACGGSVSGRIAAVEQRLDNFLKKDGGGFLNFAKMLGEQLGDIDGRIDAIEARGIEYCGVYQRAVKYRRGSVVTCDSGLWCALTESEGVKPGDDPSKWQLVLKGR